jgi:hypothetical protein
VKQTRSKLKLQSSTFPTSLCFLSDILLPPSGSFPTLRFISVFTCIHLCRGSRALYEYKITNTDTPAASGTADFVGGGKRLLYSSSICTRCSPCHSSYVKITNNSQITINPRIVGADIFLPLYFCPHFFSFLWKGGDGSPTHCPGDTHANLSRLQANLSWLIRKSAGDRPDKGLW